MAIRVSAHRYKILDTQKDLSYLTYAHTIQQQHHLPTAETTTKSQINNKNTDEA
jgi:hypothetical protein